MSKTNIEHLRDIIETSNLTAKKYEEAVEFMDAIETEIKELDEEIEEHQRENSKLEDENKELEMSLESDEGLTQIDCGYGNIWYKTDNLKLQMYMESLTERLELIGV